MEKNRLELKIYAGVKKVEKKVLDSLNNERGSGLVTGIIISAILILGVVALRAPITTFITTIWTNFSNFIDTRLNGLFA